METTSTRMVVVKGWLPFAAGVFVSYTLRGVNATVAPALQADLGLSATQLGLLSSVFALALALVQLPLGAALDSIGPRRVQAALLMLAATGALAFSQGDTLADLLVGRFLVGMGTAGCLMAALKSSMRWWKPQRQPLVNGLTLAVGGLGSMSVTLPVIWVLEHLGWRSVFIILALVAALVALLTFSVAPHDIRSAARPGEWRRRMAELGCGLRQVVGSRRFWCVVPLAIFSQGGVFMGFHSLWVGPWLRDMAGQDAAGLGTMLLVMSAAITAGFVVTGTLASAVMRRGIHLRFAVAVFATLFLGVQAVMAVSALPAAWTMIAFGLIGAACPLNFTLAAQQFPPALSGRVTTALNLCVFVGVMTSQAFIGAVLDVAGILPDGRFAPQGYAVALAVLMILQTGAIVWLLAGWRSPQAEP